MSDNLPTAIVILTDGYAPFPSQEETLGISLLWVINSDEKPPYGKLIRV